MIFGVEAWNSYTQNIQRPLELRVTNRFSISLWHGVSNSIRLLRSRGGAVSSGMLINTWTNRLSPGSFVLPIQTNLFFLTNSAYFAQRIPHLTDPRATNSFENTFEPPQWCLTITYRVQYILIDTAARRVVDFVNLDNLISDIDVTSRLIGDTLSGGAGFFADRRVGERELWNTNRLSSTAPTVGILSQIAAALGDPNVSADVWRSQTEDLVTGRRTHISSAYIVYVALGSDGRPCQVPPLIPETDEDRKRMAEAARRRDHRLRRTQAA